MDRVTDWKIGDQVERFAGARPSAMPMGVGEVTAVDIGSADQPIEVDHMWWPYIEDIKRVSQSVTTPTLETMLAEWRDLTARAQAAQAEADALFEHAGQCHGEICVRLAELGWGAPRVAAVASDGWIKWGGGERPVPYDATVEVEFGDGEIQKRRADSINNCWLHNGIPSDNIIAYRLTPSAQQ